MLKYSKKTVCAAFSIPLQLLELLWRACGRHVKQTATLDEKFPIDSDFAQFQGFYLFVCADDTNFKWVSHYFGVQIIGATLY